MSAQRPLVQHLEPATDEARISRMWRVIRARRDSAPKRASWLAVPLVAAAAALLVWVSWPDASTPADRTAAVETPAPETAPPETRAPDSETWSVPESFEAPAARRFELPDGSAIELAAGSRLTTIENGEGRFVTLLERGAATFEVRPGGPRRWIVEGGLASVEVVGTVFSVERRAGELEVIVQRGVVLVRGERVPDRVARLIRGQRLTVRERPIEAPIAAAPAVRPATPRRPAPSSEDIGELVARAARAQRSGELDEAAGLLRRAMAHDDPRAAIAAYTLGRIEMDELHRPARARVALRRALAVGLPERMAQQAERRLEQLR